MKGFNKIIVTFIAVSIILFAVSNALISNIESGSINEYKIELNSVIHKLEENEETSLSEYNSIIDVCTVNDTDNLYNSRYEYIIYETNGTLYRIDYKHNNTYNKDITVIVNASLGVFSLFGLAVLFYTKENILKPFNRISDLPYELSKGNLTVSIKENKNKYFGKFLWGLDMLREKLEQQKQNELEFQKQKKTLVLSISHDIKTPLGAIELYSKALQKNLYKDEDKKKRVAVSIQEKCDEIKNYVDDIINASNDDFLNFDVNNGEFYLSELINSVKRYYIEKLDVMKINFTVDEYSDCIVYGDLDRAVEVIQNLTENAIKYGDGKFINISFSDEEECKLVSVVNSGCTLPENEISHIFDSFYRGSNVGSNSGSGLGLYICKKLMQNMNGDIFAESGNNQMTVTAVFSHI